MFLRKLLVALPLIFFARLSTAQSIGGITTGAVQYCDSINSGFISLTLFTGQILHWEFSLDKGQSWSPIPNTTSTQSYNKLMQTTSFRAIVKDGQFQPDTSSVSTVSVYVPGHAGNLNGGGHFCSDAGSGAIAITGAPGQILFWQSSLNNGTDWQTIADNSSSLNYNSITQTTQYRVVVKTIPGCPDDTTAHISFIIQPKTIAGNISKSDSVCYGAPGDTLHLIGYTGKILEWFSSKDNGTSWNPLPDTSATLTYSTVTQNNSYKASVKNGICPTETTSAVFVALYNSNPASAGADATITRHEKINLHGNGNGSPEWSNPEFLSDAHHFSPIADPLNTTTYILTLKDEHGCISKDSVTINVIVPVPTAITPNGDGVNDFFQVDKITIYENNSLLIFNRWGIQVFKAKPYDNTWNGKSERGEDLPDDLYYYVFDFGNGEKTITNYILIKR